MNTCITDSKTFIPYMKKVVSVLIWLFICINICSLSFAQKSGTVVLDARPTAISPNGDGLYEKTRFIISADVGKIKNWAIEIKNSTGVVVKTFSGKEMIPIMLEWNGTDEKNMIVPDGKYRAVMTMDSKYPAVSNELLLNVDTVKPVASIFVSTSTISPNNDGIDDFMDVFFNAEDLSGFSIWQFSIENADRTDVISRKGTADVPKSFKWDGKDDYYKKVVSDGKYKISFAVLDAVGNKTEAEPIEINVVSKQKSDTESKKIIVRQEKRGLVVNLVSSVLFELGKIELKSSSYLAISEAAKVIQNYPNNNILIEGHTDSYGSNGYNKKLSEKRAKAVSDVLVTKYGVNAKRLKVVGRGEEKPIASNKTAVGREQNRRVEVIILKGREK